MNMVTAWQNWVVSSSVQLGAFIAAIALIAFVCRKCSARLRHGLWLLVLLKVFLPPGLTAPWSAGNLAAGYTAHLPQGDRWIRTYSPSGQGGAAAATGKPSQVAPPVGGGTAAATPLSSPPVAETQASPSEKGPSTILPVTIAFWVWAAGVAVYLLIVAIPYLMLLSRLRAGSHVEEGELAIMYERLSMQVWPGVDPPALLVSRQVSSPFLFGYIRPRIVLPHEVLVQLTPDQLEKVLLHELTHWRRRDVLVGWVQVLAQALFWFHPLVWFANARLREERENACDEQVIAGGHSEARSYADSLLKVLLAARGRSSVAPGFLGIFERSTRLQNRLEKIMRNETSVFRFGRLQYCIIAAVAMLLLPMGNKGTAQTTQTAQTAGEQKNIAIARTSDLNEIQQAWLDWTIRQFGPDPDPSRFAGSTETEKQQMEQRWLTLLEGPENSEVHGAINGLAALRSQRAVKPLQRIAAERRDKNNRGRWMAVRALSLLGDTSVVPDLIHLSYHPNQNTRLWAQIALVRLTGENHGYAWEKWAARWNDEHGASTVGLDKINWIEKPEDQIYMSTEKQQEVDREFLAKWKERTAGASQAGSQTTATVAREENKSRITAPPQIVRMSPAPGSTDVDPATTSIIVTFDQDMRPGYSWTGSQNYPPSPRAKGESYWIDKRTCVKPVQLEAGKYYRIGINSTTHQNFASVAGVPAPPAAIYFTTVGASEELKAKVRKPQIVSMNPQNGATDVDPAMTHLSVTFSVPMGGGFSWTGGGDQYPEIPEGQRPYWSADKMTCTLPVKLKPDWEFRLGINSRSHKNFQSEGGVPVEPVIYTFRTRQ